MTVTSIRAAQRRTINAELRAALRFADSAHRKIGPDTHGEAYFRVINDIEDVLQKIRDAIDA